MSSFRTIFLLASAFVFGLTSAAFAESALSRMEQGGDILLSQPSSRAQGGGLLELRPHSNKERKGDAGHMFHTHLRILLPPSGSYTPVTHAQALRNVTRPQKPNSFEDEGYFVNTPSSLACIYNLVPQPAIQPQGCNPSVTTVNPSGGVGAIALVDAYDDPTAASDLAFFSNYFDLPQADFQVVFAGISSPYTNGSRPPAADANGWEDEEALDIEWAHAMAPHAKIFLVEAQSSNTTDLLNAVQAAQYLVSHNGGGEISMSWGSSEFSQETSADALFTTAISPSNIVYFASTGDVGSVVEWPSISPDVIGVGGTTLNRDANGNFVSETAWSNSGGGVSVYEPIPSYQSIPAVESVVNANRGTPDISLDANPSSGVAVYVEGTWEIIGGTSLAAPATAGIFNIAQAENNLSSISAVFTTIYGDGGDPADFRDITSGNCSGNVGMTGYDLCTGWGSTLGLSIPKKTPTAFGYVPRITTIRGPTGSFLTVTPTNTSTTSGTLPGSGSMARE